MDIKDSIQKYLDNRSLNARYTSFDFCYNYFYSFYQQKVTEKLSNEENIKLSCMHIGCFLASWGMFRGSSFLLRNSINVFINLIETISKMDTKLWEIDLDSYNQDNIDLLLQCKKSITESFYSASKTVSDTLATKIMLGVFANVPAFDKNFKLFLKNNRFCQTFNKRSLEQLSDFYGHNSSSFDSKIPTIEFSTGEKTKILYTKAKILDMHGFVVGKKKNAI